MIDFLYGVATTLLLETVALMVATACIQRRIDDENNL